MSQPQRLLFKSIEGGDLRKLKAQSNNSATGGGARDFRFPEYSKFEPVFKKMFPKVVQEMRRRGGVRRPTDIRKATLAWPDKDGNEQTMEITLEPPTDVRPNEGRIARVHEIEVLAPDRLPASSEGRAIALFIQHADGRLRAHYTSEQMLTNPPTPWNPLAKKTMLEALAVTPPGKSAAGWVDFTTGLTYIHE